MRIDSPHWLGKYRDLLLAIGLFLVLDLGVLLVNVVISRQIEADATRINTAGELRVYTQQLTKALLTLNQELATEAPVQTSMAQLAQARQAFNTALERLNALADSSAPLPLLEDGSNRQISEELRRNLARLWRPLDADVAPILDAPAPPVDDVGMAMTRAVATNLRLLQEADDLTRHLENTAGDKARRMRQIQVGAIVLATLNFIFIVFKFLRRLRHSDRQTELAREETDRILTSVREGLFLIHNDGSIGPQRSASLDTLLGRPLRTGDDALQLLRSLFRPEDAEAAEHFVHVLFNGKVKPALLEELNPLREIELPGSARGRGSNRHLTIEFTQVRGAQGVEALLATVFDVSQKVALERALASAQAKVQGDVELLLGVLDHDPVTLRGFLDSAHGKLATINRTLEAVRPTAPAYRALLNEIAQTVHAIKGEAATLALGTVERQAHEFEDLLASLRRRESLAGDDLIPVAVELSALGEQLARIEQLVERVAGYSRGDAASPPAATPAVTCQLQPLLAQIEQLAQRVAGDLDKQVRVEVRAPRFGLLPAPLARLLREALPQLVRNAIVHGIEAPAEREQAGKPAAGLLRLEVQIGESGELSVSLRDDGRGIAPEQLRRQLVARGLRSAEAVAAMRDEDIVALLFEPGVSSLDGADRHAGRGDGLAVVKAAVQAAGGRLRLASEPAAYTQFLVQLRAPAWITA